MTDHFPNRGLGRRQTAGLALCGAVWALAAGPLPVRAGTPVANALFIAQAAHAASGTVFLAGIDRDDLGSLSLTGDLEPGQPDGQTGLEPIVGATVCGDVTVSLFIVPPQRAEPSPLPTGQWKFAIAFGWETAAAGSSAAPGGAPEPVAAKPECRLAGSLEVVYSAPAEYGSTVVTNEEQGVTVCRTLFHPVETELPPIVEDVPVAVGGMAVRRVAYATADGKTRSVVLVVADSVERLSGHIRISDRRPDFKWDPAWFIPVGSALPRGAGDASRPGR